VLYGELQPVHRFAPSCWNHCDSSLEPLWHCEPLWQFFFWYPQNSMAQASLSLHLMHKEQSPLDLLSTFYRSLEVSHLPSLLLWWFTAPFRWKWASSVNLTLSIQCLCKPKWGPYWKHKLQKIWLGYRHVNAYVKITRWLTYFKILILSRLLFVQQNF